MAYAGERIAKGILGAVDTSLYTVPAATRSLITYSRFYNTAATTVTVTVSVYDATDGKRILWVFELASSQAANIFDVQESLVLNAGDELYAYASDAAAVNFVICGAEEDVI